MTAADPYSHWPISVRAVVPSLWICRCCRRRRSDPPTAGLIRSTWPTCGLCLNTVLARGDRIQAGANVHGPPREENRMPMLTGAVDAVVGVDTHRDKHTVADNAATVLGL